MIQSIYVIAGDSGYVHPRSGRARAARVRQHASSTSTLTSLSRSPSLSLCAHRDVLLEKHYKGIVSRAGVEAFWDEVSKRSKRDVSRPAARGARASPPRRSRICLFCARAHTH
jgi:hypothetical protein